MRKSIVYNKNTPDVFYCPVHKPTDLGKIIVSAKPLNKLCELKGGPIPEDYKSDCYKDVDESEYACKEKLRIMVSQLWMFYSLILSSSEDSFALFEIIIMNPLLRYQERNQITHISAWFVHFFSCRRD